MYIIYIYIYIIVVIGTGPFSTENCTASPIMENLKHPDLILPVG